MKIEEYFKLLNLVFLWSTFPIISGPSLYSLEKCLISLLRIIKTCLKRCQNYMYVKDKYYLHVSTWGDMTIYGSLNLRANSPLQLGLLGLT